MSYDDDVGGATTKLIEWLMSGAALDPATEMPGSALRTRSLFERRA